MTYTQKQFQSKKDVPVMTITEEKTNFTSVVRVVEAAKEVWRAVGRETVVDSERFADLMMKYGVAFYLHANKDLTESFREGIWDDYSGLGSDLTGDPNSDSIDAMTNTEQAQEEQETKFYTSTVAPSAPGSDSSASYNPSNQTFAGVDFRGAGLSGQDLRGANLADANLADANFESSDLTGANLVRADLRGANLADANLTGANLTDADLAGANLFGADLSGANLRGAILTDAFLLTVRGDADTILPAGYKVDHGFIVQGAVTTAPGSKSSDSCNPMTFEELVRTATEAEEGILLRIEELLDRPLTHDEIFDLTGRLIAFATTYTNGIVEGIVSKIRK